ncbi:hypothetical protein GJR96_02725 [Haloferax sp. MBLA0076]|uniref:Uncharacterized protein n=1 Tax=Haloferax litoreum TaxID=2666140 RepID=A0A6A8GDE9_9EURY|nr:MULTISPECIES: hypothetical protein [Haloferax]KAB1192413.1 hypothetical protein Hfx1148_02710 [Haloferax sp. CBA1148]MRX20879.1 hypothetical protein [Haloferax litoreum]
MFDSNALDSLLSHRNPTGNIHDDELPDIPTSWATPHTNVPSMCPECGGFCSHDVLESEEVVEFTCDNRCGVTADIGEFTQYRVDYESVTRELCNHIGVECQSIKPDLPRHISADVTIPLKRVGNDIEKDNQGDDGDEKQIVEEAEVRIIISPHNLEEEVRNALFEISLSNKPSLVFIKADRISELLEIQYLYASGDLIHISTTGNMPSSNRLNKRLRDMCKIKKLERDMKKNLETDTNSELVSRVDSNPRYILTELNHMLALRQSGEIKRWEGDRLEKVTESAFSHIFATLQGEGGQDDNFEKMPDTVFYIGELQNNTDPEPMGPVLGVIDTKSGSPAGFSGEKIEGKQIDYVSAARKRSVPVDKVAHIFVTTHISSLNDLDFHDRIQESYASHEHMVVLTAEGLMMLMAIYLSSTLSDRVKLETNTFARAARSLFDPDEYYKIGNGEFTRETVQSSDQEEYNKRYAAKHDLLLITPKVVENNFTNYMEEEPDIGDILNTYLGNIS